MRESLRGVWKCRTDPSRAFSSKQTRGHIWVKTGKAKFEPSKGCGTLNVYVSTVPIENEKKGRKIDLRCINCNRRVKFIAGRNTARGRQRPVIWYRRPPWEPQHALKKEARARNALDAREAELMRQLEAGEITEADLPRFELASRLNAESVNVE